MKSYQNFALFVIHYAVSIQKFSRCPSAAMRQLIANETCPRAPKHYHCLEIVQSNLKDFLQICIKPERIEEGQYPVFQDSTAKFIFPKTCVSSRYQPKSMFTYERNECWYEKSSCREEGQIVSSNGSATDDRTCRCDYTKGYAFISTPVNECFCVPSKEDCSCYKKECLQNVEVLNADYMCSTVKFNETCPVINSIEYPDIPKKRINNTDINTVWFSNQVNLVTSMIMTIIVLVILLSTIFIIYYEYDERVFSYLKDQFSELKITEELKNIIFKESNSVLFECTVSKKKSLATWLKNGKKIQTSDVSCRRYICQSEENIHSLKIEKASLQDIGTYTVIIEDKLSCAMLFKKEEESSQPELVPSMENKNEDGGEIVDLQRKEEHIEKEIYDAVIVCVTKDEKEADEFLQHIYELDEEWQLDIKIGFSREMLFKGRKIRDDENLFDVARYIFIFFTKKSSSEMIQCFKNECLLVKSLSDTDKMFRVIPVSVDGPECIPFEFASLIPINYYNYKKTKNRGLEDKVYVRMLQTLFQLGRKEHLSY